jgi:hypothetical protein
MKVALDQEQAKIRPREFPVALRVENWPNSLAGERRFLGVPEWALTL